LFSLLTDTQDKDSRQELLFSSDLFKLTHGSLLITEFELFLLISIKIQWLKPTIIYLNYFWLVDFVLFLSKNSH